MDTDDDFMGEVEFDLSSEQGEVVNKAVNLAATIKGNEFNNTNPLIAIMQWWQANAPERPRAGTSPEAQLVEACRNFLFAHTR